MILELSDGQSTTHGLDVLMEKSEFLRDVLSVPATERGRLPLPWDSVVHAGLVDYLAGNTLPSDELIAAVFKAADFLRIFSGELFLEYFEYRARFPYTENDASIARLVQQERAEFCECVETFQQQKQDDGRVRVNFEDSDAMMEVCCPFGETYGLHCEFSCSARRTRGQTWRAYLVTRKQMELILATGERCKTPLVEVCFCSHDFREGVMDLIFLMDRHHEFDHRTADDVVNFCRAASMFNPSFSPFIGRDGAYVNFGENLKNGIRFFM